MTLGTRSTHELKFAEVQEALGLGSDSEVEAWVVRAIGKVRMQQLLQACSARHTCLCMCLLHLAIMSTHVLLCNEGGGRLSVNSVT